jgi:hypothetical protein
VSTQSALASRRTHATSSTSRMPPARSSRAGQARGRMLRHQSGAHQGRVARRCRRATSWTARTPAQGPERRRPRRAGLPAQGDAGRSARNAGAGGHPCSCEKPGAVRLTCGLSELTRWPEMAPQALRQAQQAIDLGIRLGRRLARPSATRTSALTGCRCRSRKSRSHTDQGGSSPRQGLRCGETWQLPEARTGMISQIKVSALSGESRLSVCDELT